MKFNGKTEVKNKTVNLAGGEAYKVNHKMELVSLLLTSFIQDQFYRSESDTLDKLKELTVKDPYFAAQAAVYARREFGMRSVSHIVTGEVAKNVKDKQWTKDFIKAVIYRADDMLEIMSYYMNTYGKPYPNCLKKGLRNAIKKFDAYQLGKYKATGKQISMVDLFNYVHPAPVTTEQELVYKKLMDGKLTSNTWEKNLSAAGKSEDKEEMKKDVWTKMLQEKTLPYFALLRNLRNIMTQAPEMIDTACEQLVNEKIIKKSLILPFRFMSAYKELISISHSRKIVEAIDKAIEISLSNVPKFDGKILVVVDGSGSMRGKPIEIASIFASVLYKSNDADLMLFSNDAKYVNFAPSGILNMIQNIERSCAMGGTNFHSIFEKANKSYDRIIILSDMQGWIGYNSPVKIFGNYCRNFNTNPYVYSIDLQGYGSLQFPQNKVFCMAGWSDKIFDLMKLLETDKNALVNKIESINFLNN